MSNLTALFAGMTWWKIEKESKYNRRMAKKNRKQRKKESKEAGLAYLREQHRLALWDEYYRNGGR